MTEPMPEPTGVRPPLGDEVLWIPRIAGEILGTTVDQLIDLVRAGQLVARSVDGMLMFREGDLYALRDAQQPTDLRAQNELLDKQITIIKTHYQRRVGNLTAARDAANAENARLHAELKRVRRLLLTALDCWAVEAEMGPHEPGRQRARDQIAQLRERGGLT